MAVVAANSCFSFSDSRLIGRSVRNGPGATQLTVMPNSPRSRAVARANPSNADLVAEYTFRFSFDTNPITDEMWTIRPHFRAFICGTRARVRTMIEFKLISI